MKLRLIYIILAIIALISATGCIEDGFTTSPSDQPTFSTDTLKMGVVFTDELTATHRFTVYNRHGKGLNISNIAITGEDAEMFRINVDGISGSNFSDVEIRANDSIYVFVEAILPENGATVPQSVEAKIDFMVNGVTSWVVLTADGRDIVRMDGTVIDTDTSLTAGKPYQVKDSLVVAEGATLTLEAGTRLLFHDKASLIVHGTLISNGTAEAPVILSGDRTGEVLPGVSFDIMSRQWDGVAFTSTSHGNKLQFTEITNTSYGVEVYSDDPDDEKTLTMTNCRLHNSGGNVLTCIGASIEAYGCEFAEAAGSLVQILGGDHRFDQCTLSNHYLFAAITGAAWDFVLEDAEFPNMPKAKANITNCITYGIGSDVSPGDLTGTEIYFRRCLFKSEGSDDANFIDSLWGADPLFYTVREDYHFDYRLKPESPAIGAAYTNLSEHPLATDFYGEKRNSDLGAYTYVAPAE